MRASLILPAPQSEFLSIATAILMNSKKINRLKRQLRHAMHRERVVITGLGTVNALAKNAVEFSRTLQEGVCGIGPVTLFDTADYRAQSGAEVKNFKPRNMIPPQFSLKRMSRADLMAFAATIEALTDACLFPLPPSITSTLMGPLRQRTMPWKPGPSKRFLESGLTGYRSVRPSP
jgi:hypothetical protein